MKKNIQRKLGIKLTNNINEILNNKDTKFRVIQEYVKNVNNFFYCKAVALR